MIPPSVSVTMKDVAAELGVSVTTISKVLNNHADIGEATRQRVLAKVEELGYRRNAVARSLTIRRTHTLGVIVSDLMHSFFVEVVSAIEETLGRQGYGLLLCNLGEDPVEGTLAARDAARAPGRRRDPRLDQRAEERRPAAAAPEPGQGPGPHRPRRPPGPAVPPRRHRRRAGGPAGDVAPDRPRPSPHRPPVGPTTRPRPTPAPRLSGVDAAGGPAGASTAGWSKRDSSRRTATTPPCGC